MSTYLTPPGGWLTVGLTPIDGNSAETPIDQRRRLANDASATPIDGNSAETPIDRSRSSTPIDINGQSSQTPIDGMWRPPMPLPWQGVDPQWVYGGASPLLGQALRNTRAKILRPGEGELTPALLREARERGKPVSGTHLWRWAPEWRHLQLVGEVLGRFQVHGRTLWLIDPGRAADLSTLRATKMIELSLADMDWDAQIDKVLRAAVAREDRLPEILSQAGDLWPFFESVTGWRLAALPRTAELLKIGNDVAQHLMMAIKHGVAAQRPMHLSSRVVPLIATPAHGSLPSGHATLSTLASVMISALLYTLRGKTSQLAERHQQLDRLARRIAFNRVVAGLHFPADGVAGYALGLQVASLILCMAGARVKAPRPMTADEVWQLGEPDRTLDEEGIPWPQGWKGPRLPAPRVTRLEPLARLCTAALDELRAAGV